MGTIKSALEIAMERTKDVAADKEALEANTYSTEGKRAVSKFFGDEQLDLKDLLKSFSGKQLDWAKKGVLEALMANLKLPVDELALKQGRRTHEGLYAVVNDTKKLGKLIAQMGQFLEEFLEERKRVVSAVERQYEPLLRQKEEAMSKQMGAPIRIDPAQDPEYLKLLRQNLTLLEDRYNQVLNQVKQEITRMSG